MKTFFTALVLSILALTGCQGTASTNPTVYIDADFTTDEVQGILQAQSNWESGVRFLQFHYQIASHQEILNRSGANQEPGVIYMLANHGTEDVRNCNAEGGIPTGMAAWTWYNSDRSVVCVNVDDTRRGLSGEWGMPYSKYFTYIAGHELGHSMGLGHSTDEADQMYPHSSDFKPIPTESDYHVAAVTLGLSTVK